MDRDDGTMTRPTLSEATRVWMRIGCLGFGGPAGQISLMHRELVEERRWVSEGQFLHALNYCMLLPGPEAQQLATYVGWLLNGTIGGLIAGSLFVLPGLTVILSLATLYSLFQQTTWLGGLFFGLEAAVLGIVVQAVIRVSRKALRTRTASGLAIGAFLALALFSAPFPLVILCAAMIGWTLGRGGSTGGATHLDGDRSEPHGTATWSTWAEIRRVSGVILTWGGLWAAPVFLLAVTLGDTHRLTTMAVFFSKMAVVTFGGAYAVLGWVAQRAVEHFGWVTPREMLDGLALAETTPGPLILVLSWVGFVAGTKIVGWPALLGGLAGLAVVTWVTYVPCFLWIFLGAPWVERLRGHAGFSAALSGIGAAVVGVIGNLALWFALHVLFREVSQISVGPFTPTLPRIESFDVSAFGLAALGALLLFGARAGIPVTLAVTATAGLATRVLF